MPKASATAGSRLSGTPSGCVSTKKGKLPTCCWNGPADKAGVAPGEKIIAINGQVFSPDVLKQAIQGAKGNTEPIHLILQTDAYVVNADIDYHDGERYPSLQRVNGTPDYLDDITTPLVKTDDTKPLFPHHEDQAANSN